MAKSQKFSRFLVLSLSVLIVLALVLSAFGVYTVRQSFPQVNEEIHWPGLDGTVDVYRDQVGVPQIYSISEHDLFMAQGYIHAQDRFWQMDFWWHIGSGRLSELFGKSEVSADSFLRTLGWDVFNSFQVNWLPSMRMIVNLINLNNSLTVHTTGQSGHAYNPHYIDLASLWANGKYYPMLWNEPSVLSHATAH